MVKECVPTFWAYFNVEYFINVFLFYRYIYFSVPGFTDRTSNFFYFSKTNKIASLCFSVLLTNAHFILFFVIMFCFSLHLISLL